MPIWTLERAIYNSEMKKKSSNCSPVMPTRQPQSISRNLVRTCMEASLANRSKRPSASQTWHS